MGGPNFCLVFKWDPARRRNVYQEMTEDCIPVAIEEGWTVLAKDSDIVPPSRITGATPSGGGDPQC
jgi:hypothetical protein